MTRSTARWTSALAAVALFGLPAAGLAQNEQSATVSAAQQSLPSSASPNTQAPAPETRVDQAAARQHLTKARDTLSQLTQLPAAAQLAGDARTQVSQLIDNFNELISTQSDWRSVYGKVAADLNALIGGEAGDAEPSGGRATAPGNRPSSAHAGTSGTAPAVSLDPAIRAGLVETREQLNAFEKASGGDSSAAPSAYPQPAQPAESDAMYHIAAIEAILNGPAAIGTSGSRPTSPTDPAAPAGRSTLDQTQINQIRTHLAELKRLVGETKK